jgi:hypothetical protein
MSPEAQAFEAVAWMGFLAAALVVVLVAAGIQRFAHWARGVPYPTFRDPAVVAFAEEGLYDAWHRCIVCGRERPEIELEPALPVYMPQADPVDWKCRRTCLSVEPRSAA